MQGKVEICGVNTAKLPRLDSRETEALLARAKAGDRQARERLISGNLRLVLSVIQKFTGRGDLFQVGCVGLIKAIDNFDPSHEVRFSTYGVPMIAGRRNSRKELFPMTRKQALTLAIQALSRNKKNEEIVRVLRSLSEDIPFVRWSEDAIRDSIEQFVADHGKVPTVTDFKKHGLPPHTVIRHRYGVTLSQWLSKNYPVHKASQEDVTENITRVFVTEYERIRPCSAEEFNRKRSPGTLSWFSVAKRHGLTSWRALLKALELTPYYETKTQRIPPEFRVTIYPHYDFRD